ncbi:MAG: IS3 family transposase [Akkermansia sp.]|nr:IS3 family transposase [Akkermansia sp.]
MRIKTIYRHPKTSAPGKCKEGKHPYLLKTLQTIDVDKVWSSDITYLQIGPKNYYLCVELDWASREVLGWSLSDNMSTQLCLDALDMAFSIGRKPEIFNTNQGRQYTSHEWLRELEERGISISMDGKGRWADNIAVERFWRTYKHDCFQLNEVNTLEEGRRLTAHWLTYYNRERPHAQLDNLSPSEYCRQKGYPPGGDFFALIRTKKQEEIAYSCQKEGGSLFRPYAYHRRIIDEWVKEISTIFTTVHEHKIKRPWYSLNPF